MAFRWRAKVQLFGSALSIGLRSHLACMCVAVVGNCVRIVILFLFAFLDFGVRFNTLAGCWGVECPAKTSRGK